MQPSQLWVWIGTHPFLTTIKPSLRGADMAQATVDKIPLGKLLNITDTMAEFVPDDMQGSKAKGWVM